MDLQSLKIFSYVAMYGNLSVAAKELNMTQPALSRLVGNLEKTLGVRLFERKAKSMELTREGEIVLDAACSINNAHTKMVMQLKKEKQQTNARIVTISGLIETSVFDRIYSAKKALQTTHPEISVRAKNIDLAIPFSALREGAVDIVFEVYSDVLEMRELKSIPISKEQAYLVLDKNHALASKDALCINDLKDLTLLSVNSNIDYSLRRHIQSMCRKRDFVPDLIIRQSISRTDLLLTDMTDAGMLLPESLVSSIVKPFFEDIRVLPIEDEDAYYQLHAFYSPTLPYQPTEFIDALANLCGADE